MKGKDMEWREATVDNANDPTGQGRVKVSVHGWQDKSKQHKDSMLWIQPFTMNGHWSHSKLNKGDSIWLIKGPNYQEYYYLPRYTVSTEGGSLMTGNDDDVIVARETADTNFRIYYNSVDGFVIEMTADGKVKSQFNMKPSGDIFMLSGDAKISIESGKVNLGTTNDGAGNDADTDEEQGSQKTVHTENLKTILGNLEQYLRDTANELCNNDKTLTAGQKLTKAADAISETERKTLDSGNIFIGTTTV